LFQMVPDGSGWFLLIYRVFIQTLFTVKEIKEANTQYEVHDIIRNRWSARAFSEEPFTSDVVHTLLEAASWAPSSMNEQPWRYYFAHKGTEGFDMMWDCLTPGNKPWAKDAAIMIVCVADKNLKRTGQFNRYYLHDCGMANANLLAQALAMGVYGHIMGGYDPRKANPLFGINEQEQEIVCFIALGYLGDAEQLEEPYKSRETTPRSRKALEDISADFSSGVIAGELWASGQLSGASAPIQSPDN
jgi:nitroreductase